MNDVKETVLTAIATIRALEDRYSLSHISDNNARMAWEWLAENEPQLFKKVHQIGSPEAAALWRDIIRKALYGND